MSFEFKAEKKLANGKGVSRRLRAEGKIPAIIYGAGKEPVSIIVNHDEFNNAQAKTEFYSEVLTIDVEGSVEKVKIQAIQRHAYKPKLLHLDFIRV